MSGFLPGSLTGFIVIQLRLYVSLLLTDMMLMRQRFALKQTFQDFQKYPFETTEKVLPRKLLPT
ncbi:hypothetical protein A6681_12185 [Pseudomonas aeruginosa]|nr:hypothetical protein AM599_12185 [Pseudomonas aeruginosa]AON12657.1 hypothetical protein A6681_12185 [Pseudomonas aeruginosa]AON18643.1 hypothetical protein A7331_12180 [Pseudomonas aeruginosa]AON25166.1 hypothetical protein A6688_14905 [Pseudomonas aeruginosa]AON30639.1 hypothetical protein A6695_12185 [Pseudomonas aeruginosa]